MMQRRGSIRCVVPASSRGPSENVREPEIASDPTTSEPERVWEMP